MFGGSTGGGQGWGVQGYISLEPQLCAGLPEFSVPERCFKSDSLVWFCESDRSVGHGPQGVLLLLLLQGEGSLGRQHGVRGLDLRRNGPVTAMVPRCCREPQIPVREIELGGGF